MTLEGPNQENKKEIPIVPYSETLQRPGESQDDYVSRHFDLIRKSLNEEIILGEPSPDEINADIELAKKEELRKKTNTPKIEMPKPVDAETQKKIDQMKKRKDLDY